MSTDQPPLCPPRTSTIAKDAKARRRSLPGTEPRECDTLPERVLPRGPDGGVGNGCQRAAGTTAGPVRAPVLVLATLWPQFWDILTARPPAGEGDPHAQAGELLSGWDISVPGAFTQAQMQRLARVSGLS